MVRAVAERVLVFPNHHARKQLPRLERRADPSFFFLHPMVFFHAHLHAGDGRDGVLRALGAAHNAWSQVSMGNRRRRRGPARGGRTVRLLLLSALSDSLGLSGGRVADWWMHSTIAIGGCRC